MGIITKPVRRKTSTVIRDGGKLLPLVVELHPGYLTICQAHRRSGYDVGYEAIYSLGARIMAEEKRRTKREARRKERRGGRER